MPVTAATPADAPAAPAAPPSPAGAGAGGAAAFQAALEGASAPVQPAPSAGQPTPPAAAAPLTPADSPPLLLLDPTDPAGAGAAAVPPAVAPAPGLPGLPQPQPVGADGAPLATVEAGGPSVRRPAARPAEQEQADRHSADGLALTATLGAAPLAQPVPAPADRQEHRDEENPTTQAGADSALMAPRPVVPLPGTPGQGQSSGPGAAAPPAVRSAAEVSPTAAAEVSPAAAAVGFAQASTRSSTERPGGGAAPGGPNHPAVPSAPGRSAPPDPAGALQPPVVPPAPAAAPVAAPAPAASATTSRADPPLADQLAPPIAALRLAPSGQHVITVRVTPENLGPVTVHAHVSEGGLRVELFAPSAEARGALAAMLPELRRELAATGQAAASPGSTSLDVGTGDAPRDGGRGGFAGAPFGERGGSGQGTPRWDGARPSPSGADRPNPFADRPRRGTSARLDVLA